MQKPKYKNNASRCISTLSLKNLHLVWFNLKNQGKFNGTKYLKTPKENQHKILNR